jgi:hypothetical protein
MHCNYIDTEGVLARFFFLGGSERPGGGKYGAGGGTSVSTIVLRKIYMPVLVKRRSQVAASQDCSTKTKILHAPSYNTERTRFAPLSARRCHAVLCSRGTFPTEHFFDFLANQRARSRTSPDPEQRPCISSSIQLGLGSWRCFAGSVRTWGTGLLTFVGCAGTKQAAVWGVGLCPYAPRVQPIQELFGLGTCMPACSRRGAVDIRCMRVDRKPPTATAIQGVAGVPAVLCCADRDSQGPNGLLLALQVQALDYYYVWLWSSRGSENFLEKRGAYGKPDLPPRLVGM